MTKKNSTIFAAVFKNNLNCDEKAEHIQLITKQFKECDVIFMRSRKILIKIDILTYFQEMFHFTHILINKWKQYFASFPPHLFLAANVTVCMHVHV